MIYVEWLRARKRLAIFAIVLAALVVLGLLFVEFGYVHSDATVHGHNHYFYLSVGSEKSPTDQSARIAVHDMLQRSTLPMDSLLMTASFVAFIFAISLYTSFYAQRDSLHVAFTKPVSRTRLALEFLAVDLASIAAIYAFVVVLVLIWIAVFGGLNRVVAPSPGPVVPLAGILLLYGWMQASTAWLRRGAGGIIAGLWVAFFAVPSLMNTGIAQLDAAMRGLWPLDPLRYLGTNSHHGVYTWGSNAAAAQGAPGMWMAGSYESTVLIGFSLGIAACAIAIVNWNRVEV